MYGARDYLAYLGYGAMPLFQDEIIRGHSNFWSRRKDIAVPYCHNCYTVIPRHTLSSTVGSVSVNKLNVE